MYRKDGLPFVRKVDCGHVKRFVIYSNRASGRSKRQYLSDDTWLDDEMVLHSVRHSTVKADDLASVRRSFSRLRDIINCNCDRPQNILFVTLTYRPDKQPDDDKKLSSHMRHFFSDMRRDYVFEYVYTVEQTARGAWHMHVLLFFPNRAPYISNEYLESVWRKGFCKVSKRFDDGESVRNVGAYLIADLTWSDSPTNAHKVEKNARLLGYRSGLHLYRCSKGIRRPMMTQIDYEDYCLEVAGYGEPVFRREKVVKDCHTLYPRTYLYEDYFDGS